MKETAMGVKDVLKSLIPLYQRAVVITDERGEDIVPVSSDGFKVSSVATFLGDQVVTGNDASQTITPPDGTKTIWITARGGPNYASVNENAAAASSGYYVPEDKTMIIGPFSNINTLGVWVATGDFAHLVFEG